MNRADKTEMAELSGLFDTKPPDARANLTAARRLVTLQRQWIDELEPVVDAARAWMDLRRQYARESPPMLPHTRRLAAAVDAAGEADQS